jgi:chromosome segregation ATPase
MSPADRDKPATQEQIQHLMDAIMSMDKKIERLRKSINGNGDMGLFTRIVLVEKETTETRQEVEELKDVIIELQDEVEVGNRRSLRLEEAIRRIDEHTMKHPSLLWSLRFNTVKTLAVIVFIFVILSLWYVSGAREPILDLLGLPIF